MRLLFEMDKKDYSGCTHTFTRNSARGIIIKNGKIAMIHSQKYDYYKFPGGGIEQGEDHIDTLIREVAEESGLQVIPDTVREYGWVHRIQKGTKEDVFIQDNYYYLCSAETETVFQNLDDYENEEQFTLEWVFPETVLETNRTHLHGEKQNHIQFNTMIKRECRVIEILMEEMK